LGNSTLLPHFEAFLTGLLEQARFFSDLLVKYYVTIVSEVLIFTLKSFTINGNKEQTSNKDPHRIETKPEFILKVDIFCVKRR